MQPQAEFDLKRGMALRDTGAQRAVSHADRQDPGWEDKAWGLFLEFRALDPERQFMTEDLRAFAHNGGGLSFPPDLRAWGAIILRAVREGYIHKIGYRPMRSKNCHANPKAIWQFLAVKKALTA